MPDRRLWPCNGRVADRSLEGQVEAVTFTDGTLASVQCPVADVRSSPEGSLDRQLVFGQGFKILDTDKKQGYCFGVCVDDGYVGYTRTVDLGSYLRPTHMITSLGAHVYEVPDMKSGVALYLPLGALIASRKTENGFHKTSAGQYVPTQQTREASLPDFVSVAEQLLGVPYLWGGDSHWGLDCSGLVQLCLRMCGCVVMRDSDMQETGLGTLLDDNTLLDRGDLVFWKGHVGIVQNPTQIIHANAHHMQVTSEALEIVTQRVLSGGYGPITAKRRP